MTTDFATASSEPSPDHMASPTGAAAGGAWLMDRITSEWAAAVPKAMFADREELKEKVRKAAVKPAYDVAQYYHSKGIFQQVARSTKFESITLMVIMINAVWIFIDTDYNPKEVLPDAPLLFQVAEFAFCFFFTVELFIRFMAFKKKCNCVRDYWFLFDSFLVFTMVFETWVMYAVIKFKNSSSGGSALGDAALLRIVRLLRLSRMARMARLLRAMPELLILIKGMAQAMRSVFFTLCLLGILLYVFAIAFTQLCDQEENPLREQFFYSVPKSMHTLLIHGALMDSLTMLVLPLEEYSVALLFFFYLFLLLASLTVMNMLIGVLCEVVNTVASTEKEAMIVSYVKEKLEVIMTETGLDKDHDRMISKAEFMSLLDNEKATSILEEVGVDVVGLLDVADFIFKEDLDEDLDEEGSHKLSFEDFMEVVLKLRGTNGSTVKDIVDLRKFVQLRFELLELKMAEQNVVAPGRGSERALQSRGVSGNRSSIFGPDASTNSGAESYSLGRMRSGGLHCGFLLQKLETQLEHIHERALASLRQENAVLQAELQEYKSSPIMGSSYAPPDSPTQGLRALHDVSHEVGAIGEFNDALDNRLDLDLRPGELRSGTGLSDTGPNSDRQTVRTNRTRPSNHTSGSQNRLDIGMNPDRQTVRTNRTRPSNHTTASQGRMLRPSNYTSVSQGRRAVRQMPSSPMEQNADPRNASPTASLLLAKDMFTGFVRGMGRRLRSSNQAPPAVVEASEPEELMTASEPPMTTREAILPARSPAGRKSRSSMEKKRPPELTLETSPSSGLAGSDRSGTRAIDSPDKGSAGQSSRIIISM